MAAAHSTAATILAATLLVLAACDRSPTAPTPMPDPPPPETPAPPAPAPMPAPMLGITRFMAFGDSITEGESTGLRLRSHDPSTPGIATSYPYKLQGLLDARYTDQTIQVFNGGRGGERATEAEDRFIALLDALRPEVVLLMTGTNDLNGGVPFPLVFDAIEDLIDIARSHGAVIWLATIPRQVEGGRKSDAFGLIEPYNAQLADLALDEGVPLVDVYSVLPEQLMTPDGIHVSETGNERVAELVFDALRTAYESGVGPLHVGRLEDAPDGVDRLALGLVIRPGLHLRQQAQRQ